MDKKEIYEHLAKIYLDASLKKTKKYRDYPLFKNLFFFSIAIICVLATLIPAHFKKNNRLNSEFALILMTDIAKINFNFNPAKKESYLIKLNKLNLSKFHSLAFGLKKINHKDTISVRVEFTNAFKEKSELYVKNIPAKWQDYILNFSDFKSITDWSEMSEVSFSIEQWNARENHGVVYIDNVRFLK